MYLCFDQGCRSEYIAIMNMPLPCKLNDGSMALPISHILVQSITDFKVNSWSSNVSKPYKYLNITKVENLVKQVFHYNIHLEGPFVRRLIL